MPLRNVEIPERVALRAYLNYDVDRGTGCYISRYSVASHGYAQIGWGGNLADRGGTTAHRAAWTHAYGQIPAGMTIDHLCKNRRCVRVEHLRMLSNFENARRTDGRDWPLGQCINGHPDSMMRFPPGKKAYCSECKRSSQAKYEASEKGLATKAKYKEKNCEKIREYKREYYHRNRD